MSHPHESFPWVMSHSCSNMTTTMLYLYHTWLSPTNYEIVFIFCNFFQRKFGCWLADQSDWSFRQGRRKEPIGWQQEKTKERKWKIEFFGSTVKWLVLITWEKVIHNLWIIRFVEGVSYFLAKSVVTHSWPIKKQGMCLECKPWPAKKIHSRPSN